MPIYQYYCPECKEKFELLRRISQLEEPASCPKCKRSSTKILSKFASFSKDANGNTASVTGSGCSTCGASNCTSCHG